MKTLALCFLLMFASSTVRAQEETLIKGNVVHGGFGGPVVKVTSFNGKVEWMTGGRGGWIINHSFILGGGGYGLTSEPDAPGAAIDVYGENELKTGFGYGGVEMEYIFRPNKLIHCSVYTLIGGGGVNYYVNTDTTDNFDRADAVFVFEPAFNGTLNVTKWFRISTGVSYRLVSGLDLAGLKDSDVSGLAGSLTFRFGKF
ncbi:hypothetical protein LLG96_06355 [bacterium]|nr:hypothetical protein [bacterium]